MVVGATTMSIHRHKMRMLLFANQKDNAIKWVNITNGNHIIGILHGRLKRRSHSNTHTHTRCRRSRIALLFPAPYFPLHFARRVRWMRDVCDFFALSASFEGTTRAFPAWFSYSVIIPIAVFVTRALDRKLYTYIHHHQHLSPVLGNFYCMHHIFI